jgi:hypothetical protein
LLADWLVGYIYLAVCAVLGFRAGLSFDSFDVSGFGCLRFDVGGLRFDLGGGLPAQPDRPGSGTKDGTATSCLLSALPNENGIIHF